MFAFKVQLIDRLTGTRYKMWPRVIKQVFIGILGQLRKLKSGRENLPGACTWKLKFNSS